MEGHSPIFGEYIYLDENEESDAIILDSMCALIHAYPINAFQFINRLMNKSGYASQIVLLDDIRAVEAK